MDAPRRDVRSAIRSFGHDRSFTILAVSALSLGIGATTAIFSVNDNVLLEPFPYADSHHLVNVEIHDSTRSDDPLTVAGVVAVVFFAAIAASLLPARAATRVDPLIALRYK